MKKHLLNLFCIAFMAVFAASCGNDDQDTVTEQSFTDFFEVSTDLTSGTVGYYQNLGYTVRINYTKLTADITVTGLQLNDGTRYPAIVLSNIPWTINKDGWKVAKATNVTPDIKGFGNVPTFTSFEMSLIDRVVAVENTGVYAPGVCFRMNIDNRYSVLSSFTPQTLYGTTVSTDADGSAFTSKATEYIVTFNPSTRTVNISLNNARFAAAMPVGLNMQFNNIPVTVRGTSLIFEAESLTPMMNGTPFDAFPISDLKGTLDFAGDFDLDFNCTPRTAPGMYKVNVQCSYTDEPAVE